LALELPSSCKTALLALDPHLTGLRWLPKEQLHLDAQLSRRRGSASGGSLCEALREVPPFFLPLRGLGVFISRGRPSAIKP
jgi:hypothetical protein